MMQGATTIERLVRRDRAVVIFGLVTLTALAWAYTVHLAMAMGDMVMPQVHPWTGVDFLLMFVMWAVMMVAMMLPSAAPMILVFASMARRRRETGLPELSAGLFVLAYVVVWTGFSLLATSANWALHQGGLMTSMSGNVVLPVLAGGLLLAAGLFQWTPLKDACLGRCRSPLAFLMAEWRSGRGGAFVMGLRHGIYCLLCCWALMSLLFVMGVMNLAWIAVLAGIALVEKVAPGGVWLSRGLGVLLVAWGAWTLAGVLA